MSLRILVCGDVEGKYAELYKKVSVIQKKQKDFDMLLCVGEFFSENPASMAEFSKYQSGELKAPIATFILGPLKPELDLFYKNNAEGGELAENIFHFGRSGIYAGSSGLKIAYLSGTDANKAITSGKNLPHVFYHEDIERLETQIKADSTIKETGVDVFVSPMWPMHVDKHAQPSEPPVDTKMHGSSKVAQLALAMKPRYHFAAIQDVHYERLPYRNHKVLQEGLKPMTRFIALAKVGNAEKRKWIYAFTITPAQTMEREALCHQSSDVTECPYKEEKKAQKMKGERADGGVAEEQNQFFWNTQNGNQRGGRGGGQKRSGGGGGGGGKNGDAGPNKMMRGGGGGRGGERGGRGRGGRGGRGTNFMDYHTKFQSDCWFCLGGEKVNKNLVISVGVHNYIALPKGGLVKEHLLIIPIEHHQSSIDIPKEALKEVDLMKTVLKDFYGHLGLSAVFYERNFKTAHMQIQCIPVPRDKADKVKGSFREKAYESMELTELPRHANLAQIVQKGYPYFVIEFPDGSRLLEKIKGKFPINFAREVLALPTLLNVSERVDWRKCPETDEQENEIANEIRSSFMPYEDKLGEDVDPEFG